MSFEEQTAKRRISIFKQSLRFQEIAAGVFIQRVPVRYLRRLYDESADEDDPVVAALRRVDDTFAECRDKTVDMASSIEAVLETDGRGTIFLAWSLSFDAALRRMNAPELVGVATVSDFVSTAAYSTDQPSLSPGDYTTLQPYFGHRWAYIDAMCSTHPGVGRLLVLHAYALALAQKKDGLIALAYSGRRSATPESKRIFQSLHFETVVPHANFTTQMYGTWFKKGTADVDLAGLAEDAVRVCTRRGLTPRTTDHLMWRCPT
jgi:hypothetical protein